MRSSITAFHLKGFKSYQDETILPLAALTVLVGANASGKTNLIEGLKLLAWLAEGNKLSALQDNSASLSELCRGRVQDLFSPGTTSFRLGCGLSFFPDSSPRFKDIYTSFLSQELSLRDEELHLTHEAYYAGETAYGKAPLLKNKKECSLTSISENERSLYHIEHPSTGSSVDVMVAYDNFSKGGKNPQIRCSDQRAIFTQLDSPASFQAKHTLSSKIIPQSTQELQRTLSHIVFLDVQPAAMRGYAAISDHKRLASTGSNLSSVLYFLWQQGEGQQEEILRFIRSLPEQNIASLSFIKTERNDVMLRVVEHFGGKEQSYDAGLLSDGTLRVLAIAAALLSVPEGSLVVIEELDNGVHPSRAKDLVQSILAVAQRRNIRVLISTHNPALMDALPDEVLSDVVFCYRDVQTGGSHVVRLADTAPFPALLMSDSLGGLVTDGSIDKSVKTSPLSKEERSQRLTHFMAMLKGEEA